MFNGPFEPIDYLVGNSPSASFGDSYKSWRKPRGIKMLYLLLVGSGGGGGGGFTRAAAAAGGGGGGGSSGGQANLFIPAAFFPDTVFVYLPSGGLGVSSGGGTAGTGIASCIMTGPRAAGLSATATILASQSGNSTGGGTGTGAAVGAAGSGGSNAGIGAHPLAGCGLPTSLAGQNGSAGGAVAGAVGVNLAIPVTGLIVTGGCGGAGTTAADFAGGQFTSVSDTLLSDWRPMQAAAGSNNGSPGTRLCPPRSTLFHFGGCGGASSNAGVGGTGGQGAPGCGGGGGGAGTTGGRGGDGGPGFLYIVGW